MFFLNHIIMFNPKDYLIEILEFYIKKLQNDSCTMEEGDAHIGKQHESVRQHLGLRRFLSQTGNFNPCQYLP